MNIWIALGIAFAICFFFADTFALLGNLPH